MPFTIQDILALKIAVGECEDFLFFANRIRQQFSHSHQES